MSNEIYKAVKWYDRTIRTFYVGMERNGELIMLDGVPGFEAFAGYTAADSGNKFQQNMEFEAMREAAKVLNAQFC